MLEIEELSAGDMDRLKAGEVCSCRITLYDMHCRCALVRTVLEEIPRFPILLLIEFLDAKEGKILRVA